MSNRSLYTDEANAEAEQLMDKTVTSLYVTGKNSKIVSKEVFNSFYELTRNGKEIKEIPLSIQEEILSKKPDDITLPYLVYLFANTVDNSSGVNNTKVKGHRFYTWSPIKVPKNYFYLDQKEITITLGLFIVNKFVLQGSEVIEECGLINKTLNKGGLNELDNIIAKLYLDKKINRKQFNQYVDRRDTLGYWLNGMLAHTISEKMLKPLPEIEKKKEELLKKYEKELNNHDLDTMNKVTEELINYAKEVLKDDPGMNLYDSGDLNFGNNYRNNNIIKGAVKNEITGEYDFITTSFNDGFKVEDIPAHANSIIASQYPASIALRSSGYMGKKLLALLQMLQIDEDGTDCGTKQLIPITVTDTNAEFLIHSIFVENGQEIVFEEKHAHTMKGKTIYMRSPMTCLNDKICSKCAGRLFYKLDIKNAGLFSTQLSYSALNTNLKAKHDSVIRLLSINPNSLISDL